MKYCPRCEVVQPLRSFYSNKSAKDGVATWCAECYKHDEKRKESRARHAQKIYATGNLDYWTKL